MAEIKSGRPTKSEDDKLAAKITLSFTNKEADELYKKASLAGVKPAVYLRQLVLGPKEGF